MLLTVMMTVYMNDDNANVQEQSPTESESTRADGSTVPS